MIRDMHIHLQDIRDTRVMSGILSHAREFGVGSFVCNSTSPADWGAVETIRSSNDNVTPFFGVHPWMVKKAGAGWEVGLKALLSRIPAGVGEIGLDHGKFRPDHSLQLSAFAAQLDIAIELRRPVAIHCVGAWGVLLDALKARPMNNAPFMVHLFSGSLDILKELLAIGAYISFSLGIADGGPEKVRIAFQATPIDRLLLETDYPYVPGKPAGEPPAAEEYFSRIKKVYGIAASLKGVKDTELERSVWENGTVFMRGIASGEREA